MIKKWDLGMLLIKVDLIDQFYGHIDFVFVVICVF